MSDLKHKCVTVIFYDNESLTLQNIVQSFPFNQSGRVIIPASFKVDKSIVAVCDGAIKVLNTIGDRILPTQATA